MLNSALTSLLFALLPAISPVDVKTFGDSAEKFVQVRFPRPRLVLLPLLDAMGDPAVVILIDSEVTVTVTALFLLVASVTMTVKVSSTIEDVLLTKETEPAAP